MASEEEDIARPEVIVPPAQEKADTETIDQPAKSYRM